MLDVFSDYDILLAVTDVRRFHDDDRWLDNFGRTLVVFRSPIGFDHSFESFGFVTRYEDGTKIDYGFARWHFFPGLPRPTYAAYLPTPPTEQEYRAVIDEFFNDSAYVAKHLWRDNLFPFKLSLDHIMKFQCTRRMLEWRMEI